MNSTLQQLFMIPSFRKYLPMLEDPKFNPEEAHDNLLFQLKVFIFFKTEILTQNFCRDYFME